MTKTIAMLKGASMPPSKEISQGEMVHLNRSQAAVQLAMEQLSHARTRAELLSVSGQLQEARAQLTAIKSEKIAQDHLRTADDECTAAIKRLENLTEDIRRTHNLSKQHAIDSLTGAVSTPES